MARRAHPPPHTAGTCGRRGVLLPAQIRTSVITKRRPQTAVEENDAERNGAENIILEVSTTPSFGDVRGLYSKKRYGADNIIPEASTTPSFGGVRGVYSKIFLKTAQSGASPCVFFRKDKKLKLLPTVAEALEMFWLALTIRLHTQQCW